MLRFLALKITEKARISSFGNARLSKAGRKCGLGGPVLRHEDDARGLGWKVSRRHAARAVFAESWLGLALWPEPDLRAERRPGSWRWLEDRPWR